MRGFGAAKQIVRLIVPGVGEQHGFVTEVILNLTLLPHGFHQRCAAGEWFLKAIEQSEANQIRFRFLNPEEVFARTVREIGGEVVDKGTFQNTSGRMLQGLGKGLEDGAVGRAFEIERPALEFRLIILVEPNVGQSLENLLAAVIHAVRLPDEGDDHVTIGRFVEHNF